MAFKVSVGLFGAIFSSEGKLLIKRRGADESLPGDWDLPGGGIEETYVKQCLDEAIIIQELLREVREETGIGLSYKSFPKMPAMYPAVIAGGSDWAFLINLGEVDQTPGPEYEHKFVDIDELEKLAEGPVGNRIVSGKKRMYRLCMKALTFSPNQEYSKKAELIMRQL
ncbi:MAG TPA: NUDIX hydrolase [Candidatus Pacearchaeota archaeon]|nr:NUDIX hydrolase [Candidatus Pacearchaeota archaeon]HPL72562.1 NUDIX hydrolase [Candidatus Pacearchaeota archaeon]